MEDNGTTIYATKLQVEKLQNSIVWKDIIRELDIWLSAFEMERSQIVDNANENNPSTASVLMHLGDINGRIKAVEFMKTLPSTFLSILELNSENNKLTSEENKNGYDR